MKVKISEFWEYFSRLGANDKLMPSLRGKIIFSNRLSIIAAILSLVYLFVNISSYFKGINSIVGCLGLFYLLVPLLNRIGQNYFSRLAFVFIGVIVILISSCLYGKNLGIQFFFFPLIISTILIFETKEKRSLIFSIILCFCAVILFQFIAFSLPSFLLVNSSYQETIYNTSLFLSLVLACLSVYKLFIANSLVANRLSVRGNPGLFINAIPDPTLIKDKNEKYILANEAYKNIVKTNRDEPLENLPEIQLFQEGFAKTLVQKKALFKDESDEELVAGALIDITNIKVAQERLTQIENLLRESQENAHIGSWEHNLKTGTTTWSEEAIRILEIKHWPSLRLSDISINVHPQDLQKHNDILEKYIKNGEPFQFEERLVSQDKIKHIFLSGKSINGSSGNIEKLIGSVVDITERKEAEIALTDHKNLLKALVQNSSDITTIIDIQGNIIYQSPSFFKKLGYKEKEVINESIFDFIHPEDRSMFVRFFSKVLQITEIPQTTEIRFQKSSGFWTIFESTFTNLIDDSSIKGIVINSKDITERKNAQFENTDKSQMLKGITSNMPVMIYKLDENGSIKEIIGEGLRTLGYKVDQLIGKKFLDIYPQFEEEIFTAFHGDKVSFVTNGINRNKQVYFENHVFPDSAKKGGLIGFALDITDKKLSEVRQNEYSQELERINNNLDQFAYIVSHDLKAPLRAISHLVEWIEEDIKESLTEESEKNLSMLKERVLKLQALIQGILDYAKASRLNTNFENINLDDLIKEVVTLIGVPQNFKIDFQSDLPVLFNNKSAMEQIFSNLISNAVKYHHKERGVITIGYFENKKYHEFFIADDGPGILKEFHFKIFEIFQTLQSKEKVDSTGVGLAIVKKVIEDQGGNIRVDSEYQKGTKFIFSLPKN